MTNQHLLLEDHTHHHLVTWVPEDTGQGLEHLQNVKSEGMSSMMTLGGVDRHHLEQHHLDLLQVPLLDDPLLQSILIALAWLDLDLDHLYTNHLDLMMHVHHDRLFYDPDLHQDVNGRLRGSSLLLAAMLIALGRHPLHVKIIVGTRDLKYPVNLLQVLVDIVMAIMFDHLQADPHGVTVKRPRCLLLLARQTPLFLCLPITGQTLQLCQPQLDLAVHLLVVLMGPHEISRLYLHVEAAMGVHRQDQQVTM